MIQWLNHLCKFCRSLLIIHSFKSSALKQRNFLDMQDNGSRGPVLDTLDLQSIIFQSFSVWMLRSYWPAVAGVSEDTLALLLALLDDREPDFRAPDFLKTLKNKKALKKRQKLLWMKLTSTVDLLTRILTFYTEIQSYLLDRVLSVGDVSHAARVRFFIWIIITTGHQARASTRHDWKAAKREKEEQDVFIIFLFNTCCFWFINLDRRWSTQNRTNECTSLLF